MSIESLLYTRLTTHAGLSALVSTRVYPIVLPQGCTLPAVAYERIATPPRVSAMGSDPGIAEPRFQVAAFATTFDGARAVGLQVRLALGRWQSHTDGVFDSYLISEVDLFDPETLEYSTILDFTIKHTETTP